MLAKLWWIVHKDLLSECRAGQVWPAMLLFGVVAALVFSIQMDLPHEQKRRVVGGLLWLATFFAGMVAVDRSFASECEEGGWEGLRVYPVAPAAIFLAKLLVNFAALTALQCVLIPLFVVFSDVSLLAHPWAMLLVTVLGNLGIAAVGTLLSAMTSSLRRSTSLLGLLALPMAVPVVLAAAETTRLSIEGSFGTQWWCWVQLLGLFALVFLAAGSFLFQFVIEE